MPSYFPTSEGLEVPQRAPAAKGSGSIWQDAHGDPRIIKGSVVLLGEHRPVDGEDNWHPKMATFVGQTTVVTEEDIDNDDQQDCRLLSVAADKGCWRWRARDMVLIAEPKALEEDIFDGGDLSRQSITDTPTEEPAQEITMKDKIISSATTTGSTIANAISGGLQISGAQAAADRITQAVRNQLGDGYPSFFSTPMGKLLEPILIPAAVMYLANLFPDRVPRAALINKACELAITGTSKDRGDKVISALLPMFTELGNVAESLPAAVIDLPTKAAAAE